MHNMNISELWNLGEKSDWEAAIEYYWQKIKEENETLERGFMKLGAKGVSEKTAEEFYRFLYDEYFVWKFTAKNRLATTRKQLSKYEQQGGLLRLAQIQSALFSFDLGDICWGLEIAKSINGLGVAGASGLLSILFPTEFGTVDQFVVKALLSIDGLPEREEISKMRADCLRVKDGELLIKILRRKAKELNEKFETDEFSPRKIDMVLWSIGR